MESRPSQRPGGAASLVGSVIGGRYRVETLLGEGGMGAVYRAEHTHMRKRFAVKVLHPEMSRLSEVVARFEREALAAAHIEHPNVAAASDFGKLDDGSFFLVLEYVEGKSLRDAIAAGRLDLGRALRILRQIAAGLQRAHAMGIVHRDLKPENVMLVEREGEPDFVKVLDFGIAKVPVGELATDRSKPGTALTQMGMVYGTPEYMAPEQALGQAVDPRADLYALGVMTYEMIAGVRPFDHSSKVTLLGMHVTAAVPPFEDKVPGLVVPPEVDGIVRRMLEKEADKRFQGAKELMDAIDAIWDGAYGVPPGSRGSFAGLPASPSLAGVPARDVPMPGAPSTVTGRQPPPTLAVRAEKLAAQVRANPKPFAIGGAAAVASVVLLLLLAGGGHDKKTDVTDPTPSASPSTSASEVAPRPTASERSAPPDEEAQIAEAVQAIERGDYGTGIAKLTEYEKLYASRPDVHRALEKAYTATRNVKDALRETELLLATDPRAASDLKIAENVRNAAIGRDAPDAAFALLESRMGVMGPDILYDIAFGASGAQYPQAAARAQRSLQKGDVKKLASPGLVVTLELRAANGCEAKRALFPRAKDAGDSRTLGVLKSYLSTKGCGFANARDCWPCMRREGVLTKTIQGLEERLH
ncbi:MAG: serine/threonine-protein kinase [Polyangiaceae bacterium]